MPSPEHTDSLNGDQPDLLDAGMEVAFSAGSNGPNGAGSVLEALCASAKDIPTVLLRDVLGDPPGVVDAHSPELLAGGTRLGRFQISGEIARGGMGVILRGRDSDLGRDVAIKVLRSKHGNNSEMVRRFVEEAQIGGQLEHPSILPIHELGIGADRRPFFTMRMIQGDTLAKALQGRKHPKRDLRRFLSIFQQICQAVAYAHARGVVHRDLKPSNVMLGNFGEVQVMDWGLAKVLTRGGTADDAQVLGRSRDPKITTIRSELSAGSSSCGSVIGTPQYMSPEQARGEVEELDERTDVFSLGAILCEILTGEPPYVGKNGDSIRRKAATAELERAKARLRTCGVHEQLVKIAWWCLRPVTESRPRDAGVLAKKLAAYVAELDERARVAELEAAEAKVRAEEECRARKLTLGLAATVLVVLMGGGAWWLSGETTRAQHEGTIRVSYEEAEEAADVAEDLTSWTEASDILLEAEAMLETASVGSGLRADVVALRAVINSGLDNARTVAEQRERDRKFLDILQSVLNTSWASSSTLGNSSSQERLLPTGNPPRSATLARGDTLYTDAFAEYGISVDPLIVQEVVAHFAERETALDVAAHFDAWAMARKHRVNGGTSNWKDLLRVAMGLDDHPWRNGFRERLITGLDDAELSRLTSRADPEALDPPSLRLLAFELHTRELWGVSLEILRRASLVHPESLSVWRNLYTAQTNISPPDDPHAVGTASVIVTLDPNASVGWNNLGRSLKLSGRSDEAIYCLRKAISVHQGLPGLATILTNLAWALLDKGEIDEAIDHAETAIPLARENPIPYSVLGSAAAKKGYFDEAVGHAQKAIDLWSDSLHEGLSGSADHTLVRMHTILADYQISGGNRDDGLESFGKAMDILPDDGYLQGNFGFRLLALGLVDRAVEAYEKAIQLLLPVKSDAVYEGLGRSLAAKGDYTGAAEALEVAIMLRPGPFRYRTLGNALIHLGRYSEAIAALDQSLDHEANGAARRNLAEAKRFLENEERLMAIVRGDQTTRDAPELVLAARMASHRRLLAASARLWADAFERAPGLLSGRIRPWKRDAAIAAAAAASGIGEDATELDAEELAGFREQARSWLHLELDHRKEQMAGPNRPTGLQGLGFLLSASAFSNLREPDALAKLPPDEAAGWKEFWDELREVLNGPY